MSFYQIYAPINFNGLVAEIDALTLADVTTDITDDLFGFPIARNLTFTDFVEPGVTLTVQENFLLGTTLFVVTGPSGLVAEIAMQGSFDIEGGFDLGVGIASVNNTEPDYLSYAPGGVMSGTGARDEMIGQGIFRGLGNDDKIELEAIGADAGTLGSPQLAKAFGGSGNDILKAALANTVLKGQNGDDTLVVEFGTSRVEGGTGSDQFIFDNGFWDMIGSVEQADANARVRVLDFESGADTLVFATIDDTASRGDAPVLETAETRFGAGDLSTLANFVDDGVNYRFRENGAGDAVLVRSGTDSSGRSYDERIIVQGQGLADIDRADLVFQSYDADTYEFF